VLAWVNDAEMCETTKPPSMSNIFDNPEEGDCYDPR
jgi:hypothetical protein